VLFIANSLFHFEASFASDLGGMGLRLGVSAIVFLTLLVGGRIVPSFTRNWLNQRKVTKLPKPFNTFDKVALVIAGVSLVTWAFAPNSMVTPLLCVVAAVAHLVRLFRWCGWATLLEPLVTILHLGYLFAPLGFLWIGLSPLFPDLGAVETIPHLWTVGTIGVMTLAVMTRASLGHSGRALRATASITAVYFLIILAVVFRASAEAGIESDLFLALAAASWMAAFTLFSWVYFPMLLKQKPAHN